MEQHQAGTSLWISIFSTIFAFITMKDVQPYITAVAGLVAVTSGILAARHYWIASKKEKLEIEKLKKENERLNK